MLARAPISVILPAHNGEKFIRAAIESVRAQTLPVSEIIVVDDGSADATPAIAESLGVRVIKQTNKGVSAARNTGIQAAQNEWIAFVDQDDLWESRKIESQWRAITIHPEVGVVSCGLTWFEDESISESSLGIDTHPPQTEVRNDGSITYFKDVKDELPLSRLFDYTSSVLIRRDLLLKVGMFDERLCQNEDLECFLRVIAKGSLAVVHKPLVRRRIHALNTSLNDPAGASNAYYRILEWLRREPEKYPPQASRAYDRLFARELISEGRILLDTGQTPGARTMFRQSLATSFSGRAMFLWCFSFLPSAGFKHLVAIKRKLS